MFDFVPYRIRLTRPVPLRPARWNVPLVRRSRRTLTMAALAATAAAGLTAMPAAAGTSAPFSATITLVTFSVTVSPTSGTFGNCLHGNSSSAALGFPNANCSIPGITITNLSTASIAHIDVQGADAIPSDGGTHWTLAPNFPGTDQFLEAVVNGVGARSGHGLTTSPTCDAAFNPANTTDPCSAGPNQAAIEELDITGPSASSDSSPTFTTTVTWIAGT